MSRRLLNRSGRPAASNNASSSSTTIVTLPDYEPLSFALNEPARRALGDLSNNRGTTAYEVQLKDSVRHLGLSVSDLHERLRIRRDRLADVRARREEKGTDKTEEESRLEDAIPNFEKEIEQLTRDSERALREVIDRKTELEDESAILGDLYTKATVVANNASNINPSSSSRRRRTNQDLDEDDNEDDNEEQQAPEPTEEPVPVSSILDTFRELRTQKHAENNNLPPYQRYALNNDYAGFKKLWHDGAAGEDGAPLPDASRWFLPNGEPDMSLPNGRNGPEGGGFGNGDDSDDEVAISRENISINCPLTLLPMREPYSNQKCPHTFERAAILDYLPIQGERQCPQTGCSQTFSRSRFKHDFFLDDAMLRRIQRAELAQDEMDVDEDDEANDSLVVGAERHVRGGSRRAMKRERTSTIDI